MEELKELINSNNILMLTKTKCKYCDIAKDALKNSGVIKMIQVDDRPELLQAAIELTGQKTVPNVWYNQKHIGGSTNVIEKIKSGEILCNFRFDLIMPPYEKAKTKSIDFDADF